MPTSSTTAPGLIMSPVMNFGRPTAATRMSARRVWKARSLVREWQMVTVQLFSSKRSAMGLPTMLLRPTITASAPTRFTPSDSSIFMTP